MAFATTNTISAGTDALPSEVNTNFTDIENFVNCVDAGYNNFRTGSVVMWLKTFYQIVSDTTDGATTPNKLIDSSVDFTALGVTVNMIVLNTTDNTETYVTAVDSTTQLSINDDIMATGENYEIYATPFLPAGWAECNGQNVSDANSPYNGQPTPDLNGFTGVQRFLRGGGSSDGTTLIKSGVTGGADDHTHTGSGTTSSQGGLIAGSLDNSRTSAHSHTFSFTSAGASNGLPSYYEIVYIIKVS